MNLTNLPTDLSKFKNDNTCDNLLNSILPSISLPNQDNNLLKLNRSDTFRLVLFFYPMTGHPNRSLPENWHLVPGASGCTSQNCSFRDNYDNLIVANALPIGITTQSVDEIKEMSLRLNLPFDILSDHNLKLSSCINLPTFKIKNKIFIKRMSIIVENSIIKKVFYPIYSPNKHINDVLKWLNKN